MTKFIVRQDRNIFNNRQAPDLKGNKSESADRIFTKTLFNHLDFQDILTKIGLVLASIFVLFIVFANPAHAFITTPIPGELVGTIEDLFGGSPHAEGSTLGAAINNVIVSSAALPALISGFAYLAGLVLGFMAIIKLKEHVENPQQTPIWEPVKRFLVGGGLFALPIVIQAAYNSIVGGLGFSANLDPGLGGGLGIGFSARVGGLQEIQQTAFSGSTSESAFGLDTMIVNLMSDVWGPMHGVINTFAYLAGLVFIFIGITRLLKSSQDGPRGPGGVGTIMTFIIAGVMFALSPMMGAFSQSIFGTHQITNGVSFTASDGEGGTSAVGIGSVLDSAAESHVQATISGVLAFMIVIGWISFVRGWFMLREYADSGGQSQQASLMASMTHIFGGALLVNLGPLLNAVQNTLGITEFGFIFR